LATISVPAIRQWAYRKFRTIDEGRLIAAGSFEASVNLEVDGEKYWAGEIQMVVAGATKEQLRQAFRIEQRYRARRPGQRCVVILTCDSLGRSIGYALKRLVEERRAFISDRTGRQTRKHFPPKPQDFAEWDSFLLSLPSGDRTIAFGLRRRGQKFYASERLRDE